ncbi:MAG: hypothetical protein ACOC1F_09880 [Myxococcota bacterium]
MAESKAHRRLPWVLVGVAWVVAVVGHFQQWFQTSVWFDEALHLFMSFSMVWALGVLLRRHLVKLPWFLAVLLLGAVGLAIGALWEVAEWVVDQYWPRIVRSDVDTILDLMADTAGSLLGALVAVHEARHGDGRRAAGGGRQK